MRYFREPQYPYKDGVITGFKNWQLINLSVDDLLSCAVWDGLCQAYAVYDNPSQLLRDWLNKGALFAFDPSLQDGKRQLWYEPISRGELPKEFSTILLRPPIVLEKKQGAKYYIEDGSGRSLWYLKHILKEHDRASQMTAYLGSEPDNKSLFLKNKLPDLLGGEF